MKTSSGLMRALAGALVFLATASPCLSAEAETARVGIKLLPFSGVVVPHQQLARFDPSLPLGVGLEVYYTRQFSLSVDLSKSWHPPLLGSQLELSSLQFLGRWRWPMAPITPFVQGGLGGFQASIAHESYGGVGGIVGGGAEMPLWGELYLQADLRSNWVFAKSTTSHEDIWAGHTELLFWAVYRLP